MASTSTSTLMVRSLYKRILRLHQSLPIELKAIGDQYVKSEFKNNKTIQQDDAQMFIAEWQNYANQLEIQLSDPRKLGSPIDVQRLDDFRPEQIGQLYELHKETRKPSLPPSNNS